jgi:hypothetical protein
MLPSGELLFHTVGVEEASVSGVDGSFYGNDNRISPKNAARSSGAGDSLARTQPLREWEELLQ